KKVVVVGAGNEGGASRYAPIDSVVLVVGTADKSRLPTQFSDSSQRSVWAPGQVSLVSPATGEISQVQGSTYSAAITAGAAALLKAAHPTATPFEIVTALQETAKPPIKNGLGMINVNAALKRLGEIMSARTSGSK